MLRNFMEFDDVFKAILLENKDFPENRILRLEHRIPIKYETSMNEFLEKFFANDPFDIKPEDLDVTITLNGKIRTLKFDRKPSTFLSIFRFLELYRQQMNSMNSDLQTLGSFYKSILNSKLPEESTSKIKSQILASLLLAGKIIKKCKSQMEYLYRITIGSINSQIAESEAANGKGNGFVNLRKVHSESYLKLTFHPYYGNMVNFCIICIAHTSKLRAMTKEYHNQTKRILN
jgi:hypothetical protein